ncbi:type II restriction endonuclease [Mammaliicoccus sciuri]|uniref:type II restriction endonuclease n=1 Tax=Mammaliicoccus sciuri TaxID=1296 RepID=UPI00099207B9|nr:type II restriction endonuclease [Mammaliicoccus sciuri]MEB8375067.1 type II restriction endonuclease [Mammaliicoccus sciuri]OOV38697.1 hypothetical protein BS756_04615 [Staphylococcus sp. MB371]
MKQEDFKKYYRRKRTEIFLKPYELAYKSFIDLDYNNKDKSFFLKNPSEIVLNLREKSWENFLVSERKFSALVYKHLADLDDYSGLNNMESIHKFIEKNAQHFYDLSLSNTQSRRSRAGTEFEAIVELIIMGAGFSIDSQGSLASGIFEDHNLGKSVDLVSPGVAEYKIQKRQVTLISCKTSLRERWSEVIEEKTRTGASEIFLVTLDEKISKNTMKTLQNNNVIPVTTNSNKEMNYKDQPIVLTLEELLEELKHKNDYWSKDKYQSNSLKAKSDYIEQQKEYHKSKHKFVYDYYERIAEKYL